MKGFSTRNLKYMRLFAETYPSVEFVQQVAAQLPWFHLVMLIDKVKDQERRELLPACLANQFANFGEESGQRF